MSPEVRHHLGGPLAAEHAGARAKLAVGAANLFVVEERHGSFIGFCRLHAERGEFEVSYEFLPEHWGRGLAQEAVAATVAWAFENLPIDRLIAVTQASNFRSIRLLARLGMRQVDEFIEFGELQSMYAIDRSNRQTERAALLSKAK